jgi:hypothetical protein
VHTIKRRNFTVTLFICIIANYANPQTFTKPSNIFSAITVRFWIDVPFTGYSAHSQKNPGFAFYDTIVLSFEWPNHFHLCESCFGLRAYLYLWDLCFSLWWLRNLLSSEMWHCVLWQMIPDLSKKGIASIYRIEDQVKYSSCLQTEAVLTASCRIQHLSNYVFVHSFAH